MVDSGVSAYPLDIEGVQTRVLEAGNGPEAVSYTHLTLPTSDLV